MSYQNLTITAIIPARGGSKGLLRKKVSPDIFSPQNFLKYKNRLVGRVVMYVIPSCVIDIDDELDFKLAELLLSEVTL